jgi:seryl-tRNA synthetase
MMAILENFQTKEGKVNIPEALHPFSFGLKVIE